MICYNCADFKTYHRNRQKISMVHVTAVLKDIHIISENSV